MESMDDYKEELEASLKKIRVGDVVTGTVIDVTDDAVIVDLKAYADGFHKHPHSYKQQGPHQPVHPCGKAGRCNDPCGGYAECGYHLYAGVSGCRRRTNDLRRAADRPLF